VGTWRSAQVYWDHGDVISVTDIFASNAGARVTLTMMWGGGTDLSSFISEMVRSDVVECFEIVLALELWIAFLFVNDGKSFGSGVGGLLAFRHSSPFCR